MYGIFTYIYHTKSTIHVGIYLKHIRLYSAFWSSSKKHNQICGLVALYIIYIYMNANTYYVYLYIYINTFIQII